MFIRMLYIKGRVYDEWRSLASVNLLSLCHIQLVLETILCCSMQSEMFPNPEDTIIGSGFLNISEAFQETRLNCVHQCDLLSGS